MPGVARAEHMLSFVFPPRWHPRCHCHLMPWPELAQAKQMHGAQFDHHPHKISSAIGEAECSRGQSVKDFDPGLD